MARPTIVTQHFGPETAANAFNDFVSDMRKVHGPMADIISQYAVNISKSAANSAANKASPAAQPSLG